MTPEQKIAQLEDEINQLKCSSVNLVRIARLEEERDQLRAENLQMRSLLWTFAYCDKPDIEATGLELDNQSELWVVAWEKSNEILKSIPHTAHLARKIELMEKVIHALRTDIGWEVADALKELDDHIAKEL